MRHVRNTVYTVLAGGVLAGCLVLYTPSHTTHVKKSGPTSTQVATTSATLTQVPTPPTVPTPTVGPRISSAGACHAQLANPQDPYSMLPDSYCTPGATNSAVTQANIGQTICVPGYTATIRPTVAYTNNLKRQQMVQYGFTDAISSHEEDHLISLELGGAPSDPRNLWPEEGASPNEKDKLENYLHAQVCAGKITLQAAQTEISTNWYTTFRALGL